MITEAQANLIVEPFGFISRRKSQGSTGYWLAPFTYEGAGRIRRVHDDCSFVSDDGEIVPYTLNAQAYLACVALVQALENA